MRTKLRCVFETRETKLTRRVILELHRRAGTAEKNDTASDLAPTTDAARSDMMPVRLPRQIPDSRAVMAVTSTLLELDCAAYGFMVTVAMRCNVLVSCKDPFSDGKIPQYQCNKLLP